MKRSVENILIDKIIVQGQLISANLGLRHRSLFESPILIRGWVNDFILSNDRVAMASLMFTSMAYGLRGPLDKPDSLIVAYAKSFVEDNRDLIAEAILTHES